MPLCLALFFFFLTAGERNLLSPLWLIFLKMGLFSRILSEIFTLHNQAHSCLN